MTARELEPVWVCEIHIEQQKAIEAFCNVCDMPLCMNCILTMNHKGHDMMDLNEAAFKYKDQFMGIVD